MAVGPGHSSLRRALAVLALAGAILVIAYLAVLGPKPSYTIHAHFSDAGQLVRGDLVEVGGRQVGSIATITVTPEGEADLALRLDDSAVVPLHEGTTAAIRQVGLVTVTNRYIELDPGPASAPSMPDNAVLSDQHTVGIVDADTLLDAFTPATRAHVQAIFAGAARALAAPTGAQLGHALAYLNPALTQVAGLAHEASSDRSALSMLVSSTAAVSSALARNPGALTGAVHNTAAALSELAAERVAMGDLLDRTPAVLAHADRTLALTRSTLARLDPFLRDLAPVAPKAAVLLRRVVPVLDNTAPAVAQVQALLPPASRALAALPPAARQAAPAISAGTRALAGVLPIVQGMRAYAPDLVGGFFNGFGGDNAGYYDANGHYARIAMLLGPGGNIGLLSSTPPPQPPQYNGYRTGLTARCPGAASEPATSGLNPWPLPGLCDPAEDAP